MQPQNDIPIQEEPACPSPFKPMGTTVRRGNQRKRPKISGREKARRKNIRRKGR